MFANVSLAARVEACEKSLTQQAALALTQRNPSTIVAELAGGIAVWSAESSPFNKVIGLGFEPFEANAFATFEEFVLERGGQIQVELSSLAAPEVAQTLMRRGYGLLGFENVLGVALPSAAISGSATRSPPTRVTRATATDREAWLDIAARGAQDPDSDDGPEAHETFATETVKRALRDMTNAPETNCYLALREGQPIAAASMRLDTTQRVAALTGASTLLPHRRRGAQSALLAMRLADAQTAGAELAVMTTRPGSKSQENASKQGFELLYVRAILIKPIR